MASHVDSSSQNLEIAICFLLVAYIFYFLGSSSTKYLPYIFPQTHQISNSDTTETTPQPEQTGTGPSSEYLQGFNDGRKTFLALERPSLRHDIKKESFKLEQELRKKIADIDKQEKARQKLFEERKVAMKGWREEELESIWREKQVGERGLAGWFRFGGSRTVRKRTEETAKGKKEEKKVEEKWIDEKRGWID